MLLDHTIKVDVEPEVKLPAPRPVRRRRGRGFFVKVRHILFVPFIFIALILILSLLTTVDKILMGQRSFDEVVLVLIFVTLFWNVCTSIFIWRLYLQPLIERWLVANGKATLGKITGFTSGSGGRGGGEMRVRYEFTPTGGSPIKSSMIVTSFIAWQDLKDGNTVITVLYSEKNPGQNVPYICADYEVETATEKMNNA
jgi:hypothetical protein